MAKESAEVGKAAEINAEKLKALQATLDKIEKDFGKGTIMKLGNSVKSHLSICMTPPNRMHPISTRQAAMISHVFVFIAYPPF